MRLIDADILYPDSVSIKGDRLCISQSQIANAPTVNVLNKIRAEIETKYGRCDICEYFEENDISEYRPIGDIADILQIIDKYKAESEEQNPCNTCGYEEGSIYCKEHCPHEAKAEHEPYTVDCDKCLYDCPQWAKNIAKSNGCAGYISKEQDTASGGDYSLQNVPLSDIDEATERFKEKLDKGYFEDKGLSNEEIQAILEALVDTDKEQSE